MRKAISLIILLSMVLHCASRLGILSYLSQNRQTIAHTIGLIAEVPIAMCSSDDFASSLDLSISEDHHDESIPPVLIQASEINLFVAEEIFALSSEISLITPVFPSISSEGKYASPSFSIFHPPLSA